MSAINKTKLETALANATQVAAAPATTHLGRHFAIATTPALPEDLLVDLIEMHHEAPNKQALLSIIVKLTQIFAKTDKTALHLIRQAHHVLDILTQAPTPKVRAKRLQLALTVFVLAKEHFILIQNSYKHLEIESSFLRKREKWFTLCLRINEKNGLFLPRENLQKLLQSPQCLSLFHHYFCIANTASARPEIALESLKKFHSHSSADVREMANFIEVWVQTNRATAKNRELEEEVLEWSTHAKHLEKPETSKLTTRFLPELSEQKVLMHRNYMRVKAEELIDPKSALAPTPAGTYQPFFALYDKFKGVARERHFTYRALHSLLSFTLNAMAEGNAKKKARLVTTYCKHLFPSKAFASPSSALPSPEQFAAHMLEEETVAPPASTAVQPPPKSTAPVSKTPKNDEIERLFGLNSKVPEPAPAAATTMAVATAVTASPQQPTVTFGSIVKAAKPPFPRIIYTQRIHDQREDWRHGFSPIVAQLLGTDYVAETAWTNTTTRHKDRLFSIFGKVVTADGKSHHGTFEFTFGKDGACYHRFFREQKIEELLGPAASQKVYEMEFPTPAEAAKTHAATEALEKDVASIVVDPEFGFITFRDSTHNLTITLFKNHD
jgi:hypothetical protein